MGKPNIKQWIVFVIFSLASGFWIFTQDFYTKFTVFGGGGHLDYYPKPFLILALIVFVGIFLYRALGNK